MAITVTRLSTTPVKGTRLHTVDELDMRHGGVVGDRRFFVVDERGRMLNAKIVGDLQQIVAAFSSEGRLTLTFPDGTAVSDEIAHLGPLTARFFSGERDGQIVDGAFGAALSDFLGQPLRLVEAPGSIDRGHKGAVTLISGASLDRLATEAGEAHLDPRRFRMTIEIDGIGPHEEDTWVGRTLRIGDAAIRFHGNVGRCLITSRDPDSGEITLPTLDLLRAYRDGENGTEPLPFGVYGEVVREGWVRVGDTVEADDAAAGAGVTGSGAGSTAARSGG
jgi:uncharacterized protein YcbX